MTNKQKLQELLTEMIASAKAKNKDRILELDPIFDDLLHQTFSDTTDEVRRSYDNCRQSCVTSLTMFPEMYKTCMADAEERYKKLFDS